MKQENQQTEKGKVISLDDASQAEAASQQPSDKEIKEYQKKMDAFYRENLPYLRRQAEYGKLLADVVEHRVRKMHLEMQLIKLEESRPSPEELEKALKDAKEKGAVPATS